MMLKTTLYSHKIQTLVRISEGVMASVLLRNFKILPFNFYVPVKKQDLSKEIEKQF